MPEVPRNAKGKKKVNRVPLKEDAKAKAEREKKAAEAEAAAAKERAQELKAKGNEAFGRQDWLAAIEHFTNAIEADPSDHVFYSNRSAANLALKRTRDAVADAEQCVRLAPQWSKGFSRLGAALWADRQLPEAVKAYDRGLVLDKENAAMKQSREEVLAEIEKEPKEDAKDDEEEQQPTKLEDREPIIGIDLGTTYSAVAVWDVASGSVRMLADESGKKTVPSYVAWADDGERVIGDRAKQMTSRAPKRVLYDVKRIIGRRGYEPEVQEEMKRLPYTILKADDDRVQIEVATSLDGEKRRFAPEEISAMVLSKMKAIAEKELGRPVSKAVITVPAYFNDSQRKATQAAGMIAGLDVQRIINEPTAAALGYGLDQKTKGTGLKNGATHVLVFDLGGGTFDVSVLQIEDGIVEVKATGGDTKLGGEDFDNEVVNWLLGELRKKGHDDVDAKTKAKVKRAAEAAKRDLSTNETVRIEVGDLVPDADGSIDVTRAQFEKLCKALFDRTFDTVARVIKDAKLEPKDVDDVVLVGGSTRVPRIQAALSDFFGGKTLCKTLHPDEAVAYGAAVQGAILAGVRTSTSTEMLLIDVTPLSLGIETEGKHHSIIIPRNTAIPCTKRSTYTTTENYQETIDVKIFEGERPCTDSNHLLGEFEITGIERCKAGEAQIEVCFALDANGVLQVTATDKKTKATANCTINDACKGLDTAEIARMLAESEKMKEQDGDYALKLSIKAEIEEQAYNLDEADCDEVLQWLDDLDLGATSRTVLEKKLKTLSKEAFSPPPRA
jgi:L1 cell adhesion molecule like protein